MLLQSGRVGEKGPQVTEAPSLATSVQPSLSILGWPLASQPRPEGFPGTRGFLKQKSRANRNSCPPAEGCHHLPHCNSLEWGN